MPARLLFIGIGVEADDKGVFQWKPITLKMRLFPADNVDIAALLEELIEAGVITSYEVEGSKYGAIRNFRRHQRPKTPNDIHPIPDDLRQYVGFSSPISEMEPAQPNPFPQKGENGAQMEGRGKERKKRSPDGERVDAAAVAAYSTLARKIGLPEIKLVSKTRKRKLQAILAQHGFDAWNEALRKVEASDFCRGGSARGWIANFDFLVQPSSFVKLLEGQFDNRPMKPNGPAPPSWHDAAEEQRLRDSDFLDQVIAGRKHG
jgi:hypothetical protein